MIILSLLLFISLSSSSQFLFFAYAVKNPITRPIISFCAGGSHACAVFDTHQMKCWGRAASIGTSSAYGTTPQTVGGNIPYFNPGTSYSVNAVTCSYEGVCVLLNTGNIKCLGGNDLGQAGLGNTITPIGETTGYVGDNLPLVNLGTGITVTSVVGGNDFTCALTSEGKVKCFGLNQYGELGLGDTNNRGATATQMGNALSFIDFGVNVTVASIHTGNSAFHSCAILSAPTLADQRIKCWGFNSAHQLGYNDDLNHGDNAAGMGDNLPLVDFGTESRVKQLAFGYYHTCAILLNDAFKCFGDGNEGQLGYGALTDISLNGEASLSVPIDSGRIVYSVVAASYHTCILYDDMTTMKCVGLNDYGQLGQGDTTSRGGSPQRTIPLIPAIQLGTGLLKASSIYSGLNFNCIKFADDSIKCFGYNTNGQLGIGSTEEIGDETGEMGTNLEFAEFFAPTQSPTVSPTPPTPPTLPTQSPTRVPTSNPTRSPTRAPTTPTANPTKKPTSAPIVFTTRNSANINVLSPTILLMLICIIFYYQSMI